MTFRDANEPYAFNLSGIFNYMSSYMSIQHARTVCLKVIVSFDHQPKLKYPEDLYENTICC